MPSMQVLRGFLKDGGAVAGPMRRAVKLIGCAVVAAAAAVTLGLSVVHDLRATASIERPSWVHPATAAYRQEKCIYHAIRSRLPQGATVFIGVPPVSSRNAPRQPALSVLWAETRLAELSTLWAVPQPTPATARWMVSLVPEPGHCSGLALEVRRR